MKEKKHHLKTLAEVLEVVNEDNIDGFVTDFAHWLAIDIQFRALALKGVMELKDREVFHWIDDGKTEISAHIEILAPPKSHDRPLRHQARARRSKNRVRSDSRCLVRRGGGYLNTLLSRLTSLAQGPYSRSPRLVPALLPANLLQGLTRLVQSSDGMLALGFLSFVHWCPS
jgi:hypothetical protein